MGGAILKAFLGPQQSKYEMTPKKRLKKIIRKLLRQQERSQAGLMMVLAQINGLKPRRIENKKRNYVPRYDE